MLATKMVLAAVTPGDLSGETTSSLTREPIPGVDTLNESDVSFAVQPVDRNENVSLPLVSKAVRAQGRNASVARRAKAADKRTVQRPGKREALPAKSAAVPCKQLDPIARFLASAKIGPRCQA
ncbi:hypothetical protein [Bradyrhizobium sp. USDA 4353]